MIFADPAPVQDRMAAWLPPTVPLFLQVQDLGKFEEHWRRTSFSGAYQVAEMGPFWNLIAQHHGGILPTDSLGVSWSTLTRTATGGAAFAAWPTKDDGLGYLLLLDAQGNVEVATAGREAVRAAWQQRGFKVSNSSIAGTQAVEAIVPKAAEPAAKPASAAASPPREAGAKTAPPVQNDRRRYAFVHQGCLLVCDRRAVAEEFLALRAAPPQESLQTLPAFRTIQQPTEAGKWDAGAVRWYSSPWQFFDAFFSPNSRTDRATRRQLTFLHNQGFSAIYAVGGVVALDQADNDLAQETKLLIGGRLLKGAGLLSFVPSQDFQLVPWLPDSTTEIAAVHCNVQAMFKAYGSIYDERYGENYEGAFQELLEGIESEADGPKAPVRRDILDRLHGKLFRFGDFKGARSRENPSGKRLLLAAATSDPEKTAQAIERFFATDAEVTAERKGEARIWHHSNPDRPLFGGKSNEPLSLPVQSIAVAQGYLLVSNDRDFLLSAIGGAHPGASTGSVSSSFTATTSSALDGRICRDLRPQMQNLFELAAENKARDAEGWESDLLYWLLLAPRFGEKSAVTIERGKLPSFDAVARFWGQETLEVESIQDGFRLTGAIRKPRPTP
jgi:hypothetical protein